MKDVQLSNGGHIFYCFNDIESYIENEALFICSSVEQGNHILVLENDRIFPKVYKKLQFYLNEAQLEMVHCINNFDFYCFQGNFHPSTMVDYFVKNIKVYMDNNVPLSTWGHVEWGYEDDAEDYIGEYEKGINKLIVEQGLISVSAYDECRVTAELKSTLMEYHGIFMTDEKITVLGK